MKAVRAVALLEAFKGVVVLVAATGLLSLIHHDAYAVAAMLVERAHLNPASQYPQIFLDAAAQLHDARLILLATGAAAYSALRFIEAYGLWRERAWAEVLAALSGSIYVPFEVIDLLRGPSWLGCALLMLNAVIVVVMVRALIRRRAHSGTVARWPAEG